MIDEQSGPQQSATGDRAAWRAWWSERGQPWRQEPEVAAERAQLLAQRHKLAPNVGQSVYPFAGQTLSRADVEWLLAAHDDNRGPIDWSDEAQRLREGLDLRGTDLRRVDLRGLPLARLLGGAAGGTDEQQEQAAIRLDGANLAGAQLQGAELRHAHLENADLRKAMLESANLAGAFLTGADLREAQGAPPPADLRGAFMDHGTNLRHARLGTADLGYISVADVSWGGANLAVVDWTGAHAVTLGDEREALRSFNPDGARKDRATRLKDYAAAVRANRQLAVALRAQGLDEEAARFAYRAQVLQRRVALRRLRLGSYLFSLFLDGLAGYGYKPGRSVVVYLAVIFGSAAAFFFLGQSDSVTFSPLGALVFSVTSFHGRGFFPGGLALDDPLTILAAAEAILGLLIELSFIATFPSASSASEGERARRQDCRLAHLSL